MGWTQELVWVLFRRLLQSSSVSIEQDEVVVGLQNDSRNLQFLDNFFIPVVILVIFPQRTLRTAVLITVTFPRWISTGRSVLWFTGVHCRPTAHPRAGCQHVLLWPSSGGPPAAASTLHGFGKPLPQLS